MPINVRVQACNNACKYLYPPEAKPEEELVELQPMEVTVQFVDEPKSLPKL